MTAPLCSSGVAQLGPVREHQGVLAVEAQRALLGTADGWLTASTDAPAATWVHTLAETDGGTGLAMHVGVPGCRWEDPTTAPGLHVGPLGPRP